MGQVLFSFKASDIALVVSCIGLLMAGGWGAIQQILKALGKE